MRLYSAPGACSMASHIALLEAGVDFQVERVNLSGDAVTADGRRYKDINPKGFVPALELGSGELLTENIAILQFIADRNPGSALAPPAKSMQRYRLQEWLGFINSDIHRSFTSLFRSAAPEPIESIFRDRIASQLDHVEGVLSQQPWLLGESFTVADCYLFTVLSWAETVHLDLSPWPSVAAYRDGIRGRASVRDVLEWERHEQ